MGLQAQAFIDAPKCIVVSLKYFCWAINQGVWVAGRRSQLLDSSKADFKHRIHYQTASNILCPNFVCSSSLTTLAPSIIGKRTARLSRSLVIPGSTHSRTRARAPKPALQACSMQARTHAHIKGTHRLYPRHIKGTNRLYPRTDTPLPSVACGRTQRNAPTYPIYATTERTRSLHARPIHARRPAHAYVCDKYVRVLPARPPGVRIHVDTHVRALPRGRPARPNERSASHAHIYTHARPYSNIHS